MEQENDKSNLQEHKQGGTPPAGDRETRIPIDEHVEEVHVDGVKVRRKGVYLLPNLFTTGALFSGFYAIVAATQHAFEASAIAIFVAMLLDGLDGRIARLTNTTSEFGVQYDSMSDLVSFGVAPAMIAFNWSLHLLGKLGWAVAFVFMACAALRLARFNTQVAKVDKRYFIGLASPSAAALVASLIWFNHDLEVTKVYSVISAVIFLMAGLLMVSNVKYQSFKGFDFKGRVPFVFILGLVLVFTVIAIDPPKVLFFIAAVYALSGPAQLLVKIVRSRKKVEKTDI
ncbi:CDP-diacylglycerol--serine O-phosphatidyltransferase [Sessilibacter corallicola]|uniref:CDP-diacylglycerol--serine O-phosphatidyltransferase n=1 Tax=Sessilibacter corallicola TaxID=2904075 RepID=UPI003D9C709C